MEKWEGGLGGGIQGDERAGESSRGGKETTKTNLFEKNET